MHWDTCSERQEARGNSQGSPRGWVSSSSSTVIAHYCLTQCLAGNNFENNQTELIVSEVLPFSDTIICKGAVLPQTKNTRCGLFRRSGGEIYVLPQHMSYQSFCQLKLFFKSSWRWSLKNEQELSDFWVLPTPIFWLVSFFACRFVWKGGVMVAGRGVFLELFGVSHRVRKRKSKFEFNN